MSIILALIIFGVLVLIHEFGHFIVAKKSGICVTEFSIGMGPRIFSFGKGETKYSWKLLPFGGSCMMLGEDEDVDDDRAFGKKSVWARIAVVFAGPLFNFLLAFIISLIVIGCVGTDPATVNYCSEGSPAYEAGLREGDVITKYNGASISIGREIYLEEYINPPDGDKVTMSYKRDGKVYDIEFYPDEQVNYLVGMVYYATDDPAELIEVSEDSAMEAAGAEVGDIVVSVNGTEISSGSDLEAYFTANPNEGEDMNLILERDGEQYEITVTPVETTVYTTGFSYNLYREKQSVLNVIKYSLYEVKYEIKTVIKSLGMLITGKVGADEVSGPVGIVDVIGSTYEESKADGGFYTVMNLLNLTIMLSANLGVMNLLPIPALDGGRLVFLIIEAIRRKPVSKEKEGMVHFIGFALLMVLMVLLLFNDLSKIFG